MVTSDCPAGNCGILCCCMGMIRGIFLKVFVDCSWDQYGSCRHYENHTVVPCDIVRDELGGLVNKLTPSLVPSYQHPRPENKDFYTPFSSHRSEARALRLGWAAWSTLSFA